MQDHLYFVIEPCNSIEIRRMSIEAWTISLPPTSVLTWTGSNWWDLLLSFRGLFRFFVEWHEEPFYFVVKWKREGAFCLTWSPPYSALEFCIYEFAYVFPFFLCFTYARKALVNLTLRPMYSRSRSCLFLSWQYLYSNLLVFRILLLQELVDVRLSIPILILKLHIYFKFLCVSHNWLAFIFDYNIIDKQVDGVISLSLRSSNVTLLSPSSWHITVCWIFSSISYFFMLWNVQVGTRKI